MNPWDRQDGETETAWRAFVQYRDNPAAVLPRDPDGLKMAKQHAWVSRKRAYDQHWDEFRQEDLKARIERANEAFAAEALDTCHLMLQAAKQELAAIRKRQDNSPDGSAKLMSEKDAMAMAEKAIKTILLLQGKPTERSEVQTQVKDMSLEDLDRYIAQLDRATK